MGMFDNFLVHKSIIDPLLKDQGNLCEFLEKHSERFSEFEGERAYYYFQTKDLENALFSYYVKEDKFLYLEKGGYLHAAWKLPFEKEEQKQEKQPVQILRENLTTSVYFYDYFETDKDSVELEFKAIFIDGKLDSIFVEKLEKESLEIVEARNKKNQENWAKIEATWEMKVFRFLQNIEFKLYRFSRFYGKLKEKLRKQAYKNAGVKCPFNNP
jgi:hypothetical protein